MLNKGSIFAGQRESGPAPATGGKPASTTTPPAPGSTSSIARPLEPQKEEPGAQLVVGPGVKLKGAEIQDCDMLLVEGRVEATMDSRLIQIADQGSFDGKVNIDVAEIRGRFSGELTARDHLIIHATGRVSGKIRYGKIVVHEGGEVSGDIQSLNAPEPLAAARNLEAANAGEPGAAAVNRLLAKTA